MQIATCKNRKQKQYFNQEMSWEEFTKKTALHNQNKRNGERVQEHDEGSAVQYQGRRWIRSRRTKRRKTKQLKRSIT